MAKLLDLIIKSAERGKNLQAEDRSMVAGHNGPYYDPETPVRNSGHWLMIFAKCYELTGKNKFKDKVYEIAEYLYSKDARPNGYSFYHRDKKDKDRCNGLIGQAWTFEALVEATRTLGDDKYTLLAEEVFFQHPFNRKYGLWNRLEIDGKFLTIDGTFNHQLWFAACASLIKGKQNAEIIGRVKRFMDCLPQNLTILENGLIYHNIGRLQEKQFVENFILNAKVRRLAGSFLKALKSRSWPEKISIWEQIEEDIYKKEVYRSLGYHSFNMYAFAILKMQIPQHPFWDSISFRKAVDYMLTTEYREGLNKNGYGYPYNPSGFEVSYSLSVLKNINEKELTKISQWWINEQFKMCYNKETGMMDRNTEDPLTLTARIYELTRLPSDFLKKISIRV